MRAGFPWLAIVGVIGLWLIAIANGQTAAEPPRATTPPAAAEAPKPLGNPAAEASPLDTFLLRDSKGNLVPVLGMQFEEFERLLRLKKGLSPAAAPGFTLERLSTTLWLLLALLDCSEPCWLRSLAPEGVPKDVHPQVICFTPSTHLYSY